MSSTTTLRPALAPRQPAAPRAASRGFFGGLMVALQAIGRARARNELLQLAERTARTRPELSAELRRAATRGWL
jgi:hypothetical protein